MKIILTDQFYKATGIKGSYYAQMRFFAYYCNDNYIINILTSYMIDCLYRMKPFFY